MTSTFTRLLCLELYEISIRWGPCQCRGLVFLDGAVLFYIDGVVRFPPLTGSGRHANPLHFDTPRSKF